MKASAGRVWPCLATAAHHCPFLLPSARLRQLSVGMTSKQGYSSFQGTSYKIHLWQRLGKPPKSCTIFFLILIFKSYSQSPTDRWITTPDGAVTSRRRKSNKQSGKGDRTAWQLFSMALLPGKAQQRPVAALLLSLCASVSNVNLPGFGRQRSHWSCRWLERKRK